MRQIKHIFSIGLNDQHTKTQKHTTKQAQTLIVNTLLKHNSISGYTLTTAKGGYKHSDGVFINENSLILELFDKLPKKFIYTLIKDLKTTLNQESIVYTKQKVHSQFI